MEIYEKVFWVREADTAESMGSGDLQVLATPAMIAMVENTAKEFVSRNLTQAESSVGSFIETKHLKPSPVGAEIKVKLVLESQDAKKVDFSFEVFEDDSLIGQGKHQRVVILSERFLSKMNKFQ